jgi:hypothetical protein
MVFVVFFSLSGKIPGEHVVKIKAASFELPPKSSYSTIRRYMMQLQFDASQSLEFSPLHSLQTDSGIHPASHAMATECPFLSGRRLEHEAEHSAPISAEVENTWIYTSTPPYVFMA